MARTQTLCNAKSVCDGSEDDNDASARRSRAELLEWFSESRRDLPWRRTEDPYAILVSEFMLQQTRVETVLRFYSAFLERFPSFDALASAQIDDVLACWSGLGYYRRARSLHAAACWVVEHDGLPHTAEELRALPGVGDYTAAAVASIAFGENVPLLDGNVERVLARRLALEVDVKSKRGRERLLRAASRLVDPRCPGDSNQALMELGATICRVRDPACGECVLRRGCRAAQRGAQAAFPVKRARRATRKEHRLAVLVERAGRVLLFKRDEGNELLAGLWELPWIPLVDSRTKAQTTQWEAELAKRYGGEWSLAKSGARVRHTITHRNLEVEVRRARLHSWGETLAEGPDGSSGAAGWWSREDLEGLPLGALVGKCLARSRVLEDDPTRR